MWKPTVKTAPVKRPFGAFELATLRDRNGTFEPQQVKKHQTTLSDEVKRKIILLFALGMSNQDISWEIEDLYAFSVSTATISAVELEGDPVWCRAEYRYDALGRRTEKRLWKRHQETPTLIRYAWSELQLVGEHDSARPDAAVQYVYEEGSYQPLARVESQGNAVAGLYWYHGGLNGLPEQVTDEEGRRVWRGVFSAWGRTEQESGGAHWHVAQNLRFQGQYLAVTSPSGTDWNHA